MHDSTIKTLKDRLRDLESKVKGAKAILDDAEQQLASRRRALKEYQDEHAALEADIYAIEAAEKAAAAARKAARA